MCLSTPCPGLGRSWDFCLMRGCASLPSIPGLSVDAAAGRLWAEGPLRLSLQQTPRTQLHPRLFNCAELPAVLHMGQHHSREQPVQSLPRYCPQPRMCISTLHILLSWNSSGSLSTSALQRTNNHRTIYFEGETL